jgi:catechol 2,3-dioxygenase-like lactoylglutathione lyase family enzyme
MKYQFHHIHLICRNLDQMIDFFSKTLGVKLVERRKFGTADGATLDLDGTTINLRVAREDEQMLAETSEKPYGYDHIGLEVEDIKAAYRELTNKGFVFSVPPKDTGDLIIAFFQGPENITVELVQV